ASTTTADRARPLSARSARRSDLVWLCSDSITQGGQTMSVNVVALLGNLTRAPELRYTQGGNAVCQFGLALNRRYRTAAGAIQEETSFVEIVVWGKQAEIVSAHMTKGRPVFVEGRLQQETWETAEGE